MRLFFATIFSVVMLIVPYSGSAGGKKYELTEGKDFEVVRAAVREANKFLAPERALKISDVKVISFGRDGAEEFCRDLNLSAGKCGMAQNRQAFVVGHALPIYLRADWPVRPLQTLDGLYTTGYTQVMYGLAATVRHERRHTVPKDEDPDNEALALDEELLMLRHYHSRGLLGPQGQVYIDAVARLKFMDSHVAVK